MSDTFVNDDDTRFDTFLEMADIEGWGTDKKSPETAKHFAEMKISREAEKAEEANQPVIDESEFNVEIPDDMNVDWSFLDKNPTFEDDEDWIDPVDENEEAEQSDDESRFQEGDEDFDNADDGDSSIEYDPQYVDVDFNDLITLPSGAQVTIQEMANSYYDNATINDRLSHVAQEEERIKQSRATLAEDLALVRFETDYLLSEYDNLDWFELGQTDPVAYRDHKMHYDDLQAKKRNVLAAYEKAEANKQASKDAQFAKDAQQTLKTLKATIPNWSDRLYEEMLQHAVYDLGWSEEDATKEIRLPVIKGLLNSLSLTKGQQQYKAKLQRVTGATRSINPGANKQGNAVEEESKRNIAAKFAKGLISNEEAFKFLEG
ncbi:hypothetical protein ABEL47_01645 [Escherichia coli]